MYGKRLERKQSAIINMQGWLTSLLNGQMKRPKIRAFIIFDMHLIIRSESSTVSFKYTMTTLVVLCSHFDNS
jgi:hypothetical protein